MKQLNKLTALLLTGIILASCSTSNNVVNNHLISKRKYNKGFFINKKGNFNNSSDSEVAEVKVRVEKPEEVKPINEGSSQEVRNKTNLNGSKSERVSSDPQEPLVASTDQALVERKTKGTASEIPSLNQKMDKEAKAKRDVLQKLQQEYLPSRPDTSDPVMLILLIILALILPPVAIAIYSGITGIFWLDLVLFLLAWGGFWFFRLSGLLHLAAIIIAFLVIFDVI